MKKLCLGLGALLFCLPALSFGADLRTLPMDVYLILDPSPALGNQREAAVKWLCDQVIEGQLVEGDTLTILNAGSRPAVLFSDTIGAGNKEAAKEAVRKAAGGDTADYPAALREAASRQAARGGRLSYTLLISGTGGPSAASGGLVRYSRVQEFSGWRALTVGLGLERRVREAAAAYMR